MPIIKGKEAPSWTGVGGQTAFAIAANYSRGGRSITVLPSSHLANGQRPALPEGAVGTVPRTLVDYVVTEHGIATMRGKSVRERVGEHRCRRRFETTS